MCVKLGNRLFDAVAIVLAQVFWQTPKLAAVLRHIDTTNNAHFSLAAPVAKGKDSHNIAEHHKHYLLPCAQEYLVCQLIEPRYSSRMVTGTSGHSLTAICMLYISKQCTAKWTPYGFRMDGFFHRHRASSRTNLCAQHMYINLQEMYFYITCTNVVFKGHAEKRSQLYIYITGMVLDTTRMGGENKNPRKHCRHRSFEEKEEEKKFNNQGFGVAVWHASAAVHVCRMPSILFVTLDENGVCSAATESTTAEICIVLLTSKCATLFKLYSNAIHSAQIRLARFINAANHQIPLWPNISGSVMPATMAWISPRKRCKSSRSGLRQHLHMRGMRSCRGPISVPRAVHTLLNHTRHK